ncbi:MAG: GtrA family protein [Lachnospiraceae bacterium]|nr:GtrA family protein [Lachnospiraceae bacterium]
MKKLFEQILKFGAVGFFCFFIDFAIYTILLALIDWHYDYVIATFWGFTISVIVNYLLSMKYVFVRKDDMDRRKEFVVFVILSIIGCLLNEVLIVLCMNGIYDNWPWLQSLIGRELAKMGGKIVATGVVMVYNFITRKIFLEKKQEA